MSAKKKCPSLTFLLVVFVFYPGSDVISAFSGTSGHLSRENSSLSVQGFTRDGHAVETLGQAPRGRGHSLDDCPDVHIKGHDSIDAKEGNRVSLTCNSDEGASVEWTRAGAQALPWSSSQSAGRLTINNIRVEDAGTYRCVIARPGCSDHHGDVAVNVAPLEPTTPPLDLHIKHMDNKMPFKKPSVNIKVYKTAAMKGADSAELDTPQWGSAGHPRASGGDASPSRSRSNPSNARSSGSRSSNSRSSGSPSNSRSSGRNPSNSRSSRRNPSSSSRGSAPTTTATSLVAGSLTPAQVRPTDLEFDVTPLDAFLRKCPDCFTLVEYPGLCPLHEPALDMKMWAHELGDLLSHGCKPKDCVDRCCVSEVAPVSTLAGHLARMLENMYHLLKQHCESCNGTGSGLGIPHDELEWSTWSIYCACDCRTGLELRERRCLHNGVEVPAGVCRPIGGLALDSRKCDVRTTCPVCITSCENRGDGNYPACSSCSDYVQCRKQKGERFHCKRGAEWDAFVGKCVMGPSPSCSLKTAPYSCFGLRDGIYASPNTCTQYSECTGGEDKRVTCPTGEEYNHHALACQPERSPTCVRGAFARDVQSDQPVYNRGMYSDQPSSFGGGLARRISPMEVHHSHDDHLAPDYMYYDQARGLTPAERRQMYALGVDEEEFRVMNTTMTRLQLEQAVREVEDEKEAEGVDLEEWGVRADEGVREEDLWSTMEREDEAEEKRGEKEDDGLSRDAADRRRELMELIHQDRLRRLKAEARLKQLRVQPVCLASCAGMQSGKYASCHGCRRFVYCNKDGDLRRRKCDLGWEFDAAIGECVEGKSSSCVDE